jgi:hypothetical protein
MATASSCWSATAARRSTFGSVGGSGCVRVGEEVVRPFEIAGSGALSEHRSP